MTFKEDPDPIVNYLAKHIWLAYRSEGFVGIVIYGLQGAGKSCLALRVAHSCVGSWRKVLSTHLVFTAEELERALLKARAGGFRWKVLVWDDAGVFGGKYLTMTDIYAAEWLTTQAQLIRTYAASLILTTPSPNELLKSLREQPDWLRVKVRPRKIGPPKEALVQIQRIDIDALGKPRAKKIIDDAVFTVRIPNYIYREYKRIRESYLEIAAQMKRKREELTGEIQAEE